MTTNSAQPRPRRLRRWAVRLLVGLAIAIVVLIIAVQILFWTNVPRNVALPLVQQALGLRVTADQLTTGFFGHTTLRNVTLALPLSDESFFKVDELRVEHTSVPGILFKRSVALQSVSLDDFTLVVQQNAAGRWNLEDVAELLARAAGSGNPQQPAAQPAATLALPKVSLTNGRVRIVANTGPQIELAPLTVKGQPQDTLTWRYDVAIAEQLKATGRVAPGGDFGHEVDVKLQKVDQWIALIAPGFAHEIAVDATWRGRLAGGGMTGRLDLAKASFDAISASGPIAISAGNTIEARPQGLKISTGQAVLPEIAVVGGALRSEGAAIVVDRLRTAIGGGTASLSARYVTAAGTLKADALWQDITIAGATLQSGNVNVDVTQPIAGRPKVNATLATLGSFGSATWNTAIRVDGATAAAGRTDWTIVADRLNLAAAERKADLKGLTARVDVADGQVTLTSLSRPGMASALKGGGRYDTGNGAWYAWVNGLGPRLPGGDENPLQFSVDAWGDRAMYQLKHFYLGDNDIELSANGYYLSERPEPVFLNLSITQRDVPAATTMASTAPPVVGGRVFGDFYIHGKTEPVDLYMQGWLTGKNVVIAERPLGDLKVTMDGTIDKELTLHARTRELTLFEGRWSLQAHSPTPWNTTRIQILARNLPLKEIGVAAGREDVGGTFNGQWNFDLVGFTPNDVSGGGIFHAADIVAGPARAKSLDGRTWIRSGMLRNELTFKEGDGVADISLTTPLAAPTQLQVRTKVQNWPAELVPGTTRATASVDSTLSLDLSALSAVGSTRVSASAVRNDKPLADTTLKIDAAGRVFTLSEMKANLLSGTATGTARFDLDQPLQSVAQLTWYDLDGTAIAALFPQAEGLAGLYSGSFMLAPDTSPRRLAPLSATITNFSNGGNYKAAAIGDLDVLLAIDFNKSWRIVADHIKLGLAQGTVDAWARATQHTSDDPILKQAGRDSVVMTQASVRYSGLDLNSLVQAVAPNDRPLLAKLGGEFNLFMESLDNDSLVASGFVALSEGKLVNFQPVRQLFQQLGVKADDSPGKGTGRVALRMERNRVDINRIDYYESGIEMRGVATIYDLGIGKQSPIKGSLAGSLRPLRGSKISVLATADDVLAFLQGFLQAVSIDGTLGDPKVAPAALTDIGDSLKEILTGDARSQTEGPK